MSPRLHLRLNLRPGLRPPSSAVATCRPGRPRLVRAAARAALALATWAWLGAAQAGLGLATLADPAVPADGGPETDAVSVFYPTDAPDQAGPVAGGRLHLAAARDATPRRGNGALVVLSHGSGGTPWVHTDLIRRLVDAGFVVAVPTHQGDNARDPGRPGPDSWALRPAEVSAAIDRVAADSRFGPLLQVARVGVYGQSAGGHTALSMAGGRWSRARFAAHCQAHIAEDFNACVGLALRQTGGWADGLKRGAARLVLGLVFRDDTLHAHHDPRVAAVVAGNPAAADFDPASLARPAVPLALVTTRRDRWLHPAFHGDRILAACLPRCTHLMDLPQGGHGALLAPLPPVMDGLLAELLADPPGFDRGVLATLDERIVGFFQQHLLR